MSAFDRTAYEVKETIDNDPKAPARIDIKFQLPAIKELHRDDRNKQIGRAVYECIKKYLRTINNETNNSQISTTIGHLDHSRSHSVSYNNKLNKDELSRAIESFQEKICTKSSPFFF